MARYLLFVVVLPAAVVNFAINLAAGAALFPPGRAIPLPSLAADALVGALLIATITLRLVVPGARREARAGRIRGRGWRGPWRRWLDRRPGATALAGGALLAAVFAGPVVAAWAAAGVDALPRDTYVWIKGAMSAGIAVVAALAAAAIGIGVEPPAPPDPRWCRDPQVAGDPCQYLDKGGLAVTDRARGCSATPTWHLVLRGRIDPVALRRAVADLLVRYPSLATRVRARDGVAEYATRFAYVPVATEVDDVLAVADLRGGAADALDALLDAERNRHCDLFTDPPVTFTLAITGDDAGHLIVRQHHAIADGRAFIGLLADLAAFVEAAREGRRPDPAALAPVPRRDELDALGLDGARRALDTAAGVAHVLGAQLRAALRPLTPLRQNRSNDYTGANGTVHWRVDDDQLAAWKARGKALGVSLNSLLTGALFAATRRWHAAIAAPFGRTSATLMMETRPRDPTFRSFANHLASIDVRLDLRRRAGVDELAREVQRQVDAQRRRRTPIRRFLGERLFVRALPLDELHRVVFHARRPARSLDFSNLIALDFPALGGDGWSVDEVRITTPVVPRAGIVLTVIRYRGAACFNFNYKSTAVTRAEVEDFAAHFAAVLAAPGATPATPATRA